MTEKILKGIGVSEGIQISGAYKYERIKPSGDFGDILENEAEDAAKRFDAAVKKAALDVDSLIAQSEKTLGEDKIGVLKGQKSILADPAYCPEIEKLIRKKLFSPEKAVKTVTDKFAMIFENMKNAYMKERAADVRDAGSRLLSILSGKKTKSLSEIEKPVILIADDLMPSDTIQLDKKSVLAFATEKGGKTSHTSIFAKSMGIPAVVGISGLFDSISNGETLIVDGSEGLCIINPEEKTLNAYKTKMQKELDERRMLEAYAKKEGRAKSGERLVVAANTGSFADAEKALRLGAEAVGLMRTEQLYLSRDKLPGEEEQFLEYKKTAEAFSGKEVIIRTLDIGGDKKLSYLAIPKEENPFMGYRAIRLCLDRKDLFLTQLRAILRASAFGNLKIMFPMISGVDELRAAKEVLEEAKAQLKKENTAFDENIKTGIMIEVPSAAVMADALAKEADFFSIGTNDLIGYTLAADRGNEKISYLYDYCNPAVIRLLKGVLLAAHKNGIPVGMCGGMAGDALAIPLLFGIGLDELSMPAGAVPKAKYVIGKLDKALCKKFSDSVEAFCSPKEIRKALEDFYKTNIA